MNEQGYEDGVYFVYDGECPICSHAAKATRIKEKFGGFSTIDARTNLDNPLVHKIKQLGLDLDEGMVIYANGRFYHGKKALTFIAKYGDPKNGFMFTFKSLFWSDRLANFLYPWMRGVRNFLLKRKKVGQIDNLGLHQQAIFQPIFGDSWNELPAVFKKHYGNRPYSSDVTVVEGSLDVYCKAPLLWLSPILRLLGQIPAINENDVPTRVVFESDQSSKSFYFNRVFKLNKGRTYHFKSRMLQLRNDEVIEIMNYGFVWKTRFLWDGEKVVLKHNGYAFRLFGHLIPLPLTFLMGAGNAAEYAVDENTFDMEVSITHPWWGNIFGYKGRFEVRQ